MNNIFVAVLLAGGLVAGSSPTSQALNTLTVPATALSSDCALTPPPAPQLAPVARGGTARSPYPTNPWSGTDRKMVASVHAAIDATGTGRALPDLPPSAPVNDANATLTLADNILEAYHAAYVSGDGHQVDVFAVTFNNATLTTAPESVSALLNPPNRLTKRLVRGATVIRVSAPPSTECFGAVRTWLESLK